MKKNYTLHKAIVWLFIFSIGARTAMAQTPTMSKTGGTNANNIPFNTATVLKTQNIYVPSVLVGSISGPINRIFLRSAMVSTSTTLANFTIKMGQTTATTYSGSGLTFFTGLTTVYSSASQVLTTASTAGNWFYIDLPSAYTYDASKTLIVEFSFTSKTSGGISLYSSTVSTAPNNKRLHATSVSATTGVASNLWTDIGFGFNTTVSCSTPADQATSLNLSTPSFSSVTGSFTAASSNPTGYLVVQYPYGATVTLPSDGSTYAVGDSLGLGTIVSNNNTTSFTKNGLNQATTYSYYVYAYNTFCVGGPKYNTTNPLIGQVTTTLSCTPSDQATSLTLSSTSSSSISGSFTAAIGNPDGYLVVQYPSGSVETPPVNGTNYTLYGSIGLGTIVSIGTATSFTKNGLNSGTTYDYYVYSYNYIGCILGPVIKATNPLFGSATTLSCTPANQPTNLVLTPTSTTSVSVSFTAAIGNPHGYLVVQYPSGSIETPPVNGTSYALSTSLGLGTVVSVGTATSFPKNGLNGGTTYDYYVYSYNTTGCIPGPIYKTTNPLFGSTTTLSCTPANQPTNLVLTPLSTTSVSASFTTAIGNPHGYLVVQYPSGAVETPPVNGTSYALSTSLGAGTVVSAGTATSFTKNGLNGGTTYDYYVYSYNSTGCTPGPIYNVNNPLMGNATTYACMPAFQATNLTTVSNSSNTITGSFSPANGNPEGYLVVYYPHGASVTPPMNGTIYAPSNQLGLGTIVSSGNSVNFTQTGLTFNTTYDFYVYAYNSSGCTSGPIYNTTNPPFNSATTINCSGSLNMSITAFPTSICSGEEVIVSATGADSFVWQPYGGTLDFISDFPSTTTTYTVTGTSVINGCTITQTKTLTVNVTQTPIFYISDIGTICPGSPHTLIANGGGAYNYSWQPSNGFLSLHADTLTVLSMPTTTTYTVNAYNGSCSYNNVIYTVYIEDPVSISSPSNNTGYCNHPVTLTGSVGMSSFVWQPGGATTPSIAVSPSATTIYTVTGTSLHNCVSTSTKVVTVPAQVQITATPSSVCGGGVTNLTSSNVLTVKDTFKVSTPLGIPIYGSTSQQLTVSGLPSGGAQLKSVVFKDFNHDESSDLSIRLTSPTGQQYYLMIYNGSGYMYADLTFIDGYPAMPYYSIPTGTYSPVHPLGNFTGNMNGNWLLEIQDVLFPNSGSLGSWELHFEYPDIQWTSSTTPVNSPDRVTTTATVPSTTTYTATVTDAYGCSSTKSVTVNVAPCPVACTVKLLLQGYYLSGLNMQPVLMNQGRGSNSAITDSVEVNLYHPTTHALVATSRVPVSTSGSITPSFNVVYGNYYISVKHRNSIEVWSASPVYLSATNVNYIFYNQANSAFGSNQVEVAPGKWALYTGDINQDGFIDNFDYPALDADNYNGVSGEYVASDLNGDGFVDIFDYPIFDANSAIGVSTVVPW